MGKQKRGKTRVKPQVSSFGRVMNRNGKISTPVFCKNSNVARFMIYGKNHCVRPRGRVAAREKVEIRERNVGGHFC